MDRKQAGRRAGINGVALGIALAALAVGAPGAGAATPTWEQFRGDDAGRPDVVVEMARAAYGPNGSQDPALGFVPGCSTELVVAAPDGGPVDVAAELTRASYAARPGWGAEALFVSAPGEEWASTRQYPGKPH